MNLKNHPLDQESEPVRSPMKREKIKLKYKLEEREAQGRYKSESRKEHKGARQFA